MAQEIEGRQTPAELAKTIQSFAQRGLTVQAEVAESLVQASRHWIEQFQTEWMEAVDLVRRFHANDSAVEKVGAVQGWMKGVTERGIRDASYAIEVGRALGNIELKLFSAPPAANDTDKPKAA
ncbi:MAG TPA: hypothetical protein VGJ08_05305 [Rhizomicrobium sp.]|jgi:hypothetical protein